MPIYNQVTYNHIYIEEIGGENTTPGIFFMSSGSNLNTTEQTLSDLGEGGQNFNSTPQIYIISCSANEGITGSMTPTASLNSYMLLPLAKGTFDGARFMNSDPNEYKLIVRYYRSSSSDRPDPNGLHQFTNDTLYYTGSTALFDFSYCDIPLFGGENAAQVANRTYNALLTGSPDVAYKNLHNRYYSCSLEGSNIRVTGIPPQPMFHPIAYNSVDTEGQGALLKFNIIQSGSGSPGYTIPNNAAPLLSSSFIIGHEGTDPSGSRSILFQVPRRSFGGSEDRVAYYVSASGEIGVNTKSPKSKFDVKANTFKVRSDDGVRELIFEEDGRLAAKKYSGTATSESIGGIIQLSYTPGTFEEPTIAREGETIGTINFVDESLNKLTAGLDSDDVLQKYQTSASVAQITSTVKFAEPGVGVIGNLEFKVSPNPSGEAEYSSKSKASLITYLTIDPITYPLTGLYLPLGATIAGTVYQNGGDIVLANDKDIQGKETGGTSRHLLSVSTKNIARVGATGTPLSIRSNGNVTVTGSLSATSYGTINGGSF